MEEKQKLNNIMEKTQSMIILTPKFDSESSKKILELSPRKLLEASKINKFITETNVEKFNNPF